MKREIVDRLFAASAGRVNCPIARAVGVAASLAIGPSAFAVPPKPPHHCPESTAVALWVEVKQIADAKGEIAITLYDEKTKRFLRSGGRLDRQRLDARSPSIRSCFALPKPGRYAVSVYHDRDDDSDFDRDALGRPAEPFGFSNNPKTRYGLPSLRHVLFDVKAGQNEIQIEMKQ